MKWQVRVSMGEETGNEKKLREMKSGHPLTYMTRKMFTMDTKIYIFVISSIHVLKYPMISIIYRKHNIALDQHSKEKT